MTLSDLLSTAVVKIPILARDKAGALEEMTDLLLPLEGLAGRREELLKALWARERLLSTGIGRGVAIPHAELSDPVVPAAAIGVSPEGIEFDAPDGKPVNVLFVLVAGRENGRARIQVLSLLSRVFRKEGVRQEIRSAPDAAALLGVFRREEEILRRTGPTAAQVF